MYHAEQELGGDACHVVRTFAAKARLPCFARATPFPCMSVRINLVGDHLQFSGTLLSRMSVQLKPGQLISVQRTPSIHHLAHCALNAPHHVSAAPPLHPSLPPPLLAAAAASLPVAASHCAHHACMSQPLSEEEAQVVVADAMIAVWTPAQLLTTLIIAGH